MPQAWILPALQNPDRAALFYTYAALYSYPLLKDGFDIEGYTLVMLLLGIIHIQVRIQAHVKCTCLQQVTLPHRYNLSCSPRAWLLSAQVYGHVVSEHEFAMHRHYSLIRTSHHCPSLLLHGRHNTPILTQSFMSSHCCPYTKHLVTQSLQEVRT